MLSKVRTTLLKVTKNDMGKQFLLEYVPLWIATTDTNVRMVQLTFFSLGVEHVML